jgi:hypothetical protein
LNRRLAALLVAVPLATSFASSAHADPIVSGCYGAYVVVCDPSVSVPVEVVEGSRIPVCAGTCTYVSVPSAGTTGGEVCVEYTNDQGSPQWPGCRDLGTIARAVLCVAQTQYCD